MPSTITVTDAHGLKVRAKAGDNVLILRAVDVKRKKNARVAKFPAPIILELERNGSRVHARVQFHTEDKRVHVQSFVGTDLQLAAPMFKIGDVVEVVENHVSVFVPVGSQGTVVGGDGTTFYVTFLVHKLADGSEVSPPQTVSQTGVHGTALSFVKSGTPEGGRRSESDECSSSEDEHDSDESSSSGSSSGSESDEDEGEEDQKHPSSTSACQEDVREVDFLKTHMSDVARAALLRHLRANTLASFKTWFSTKCQHVPVRVNTLPELQHFLIEFTRNSQPAFHLSPAHKVALRNIGASSADLLEIEHVDALRGGELKDFMKFFTEMRR